MSNQSQFTLLGQRRFGPFFATQLLGAFNDNVFKNALIILIAYGATSDIQAGVLTNLSAGLFVLPYFLFSATCGQLADKLDKASLIRMTKGLEIIIMIAAAIAFMSDSLPALITLLFLMGTQSTLFGPVKYSILPQHLAPDELVGGNGLVESGTFLAILLGTLTGGILISIEGGERWVAIALVFFAIIGYLTSLRIPSAPPNAPSLTIGWNPAVESWRIFQHLREHRTVFLSVLGISWFWLLGSLYLAQLPIFSEQVLFADEQTVTLLLVLFSLGIGIGSLLCERLSGHKVELGLVPLGSIGISAFGIDLYFAAAVGDAETIRTVGEFVRQPGATRVLIDIVFVGIFGGFYIVPLYALIQQRSDPSHRSRVIAGNNILNAFFMVVGAILAVLILSAGLGVNELFLLLALTNVGVAIYIYTLVPEFMMRFITWVMIHLLYRIDKSHLDRIPEQGPAVLVCNHVSFVDALIIGGCSPRPIRFVMFYKIFRIPLLSFVFKTARAIPIAGSKEDPELLEKAYDDISAALDEGDLVCIFPEGQITRNGELNTFRPGIERIIERNPVPVIPLALQGLWGSFFSRRYGAAMMGIPRRLWSKIALVVGLPVMPADVTASDLQNVVADLRGDWL